MTWRWRTGLMWQAAWHLARRHRSWRRARMKSRGSLLTAVLFTLYFPALPQPRRRRVRRAPPCHRPSAPRRALLGPAAPSPRAPRPDRSLAAPLGPSRPSAVGPLLVERCPTRRPLLLDAPPPCAARPAALCSR
jgi:hypothetical protein